MTVYGFRPATWAVSPALTWEQLEAQLTEATIRTDSQEQYDRILRTARILGRKITSGLDKFLKNLDSPDLIGQPGVQVLSTNFGAGKLRVLSVPLHYILPRWRHESFDLRIGFLYIPEADAQKIDFAAAYMYELGKSDGDDHTLLLPLFYVGEGPGDFRYRLEIKPHWLAHELTHFMQALSVKGRPGGKVTWVYRKLVTLEYIYKTKWLGKLRQLAYRFDPMEIEAFFNQYVATLEANRATVRKTAFEDIEAQVVRQIGPLSWFALPPSVRHRLMDHLKSTVYRLQKEPKSMASVEAARTPKRTPLRLPAQFSSLQQTLDRWQEQDTSAAGLAAPYPREEHISELRGFFIARHMGPDQVTEQVNYALKVYHQQLTGKMATAIQDLEKLIAAQRNRARFDRDEAEDLLTAADEHDKARDLLVKRVREIST